MARPSVVALAALVFSGMGLGRAPAQEAPAEKLAEPKGQEFIHYRVEGRRPFEMIIARDGAVTVLYRDTHPGEERETFRIGPDELAAFDAAVACVGFFTLPEPEAHLIEHDGVAHLRITSQGKTRSLTCDPRPEIELLNGLLYRAFHQGVILHELRVEKKVYSALCAVCPHSTGMKVLNPRVLEEPIRAFAEGAANTQTLGWALEALAHLLSEDQWLGYLWRQLTTGDAGRTTLVLRVITGHPFYGDIPKSHLRPICALLTHQLRADLANYAALPEPRRSAHHLGIHLLGEQRHEAAIPVLVKAAEAGYLECAGAIHALYTMVPAALDSLEGLLDHPDKDIRRTAAVALGDLLYQRAVRTGPGAPTKDQQAAILARLRTRAAPKLKSLADTDEAIEVRQAAARSLERIEKGWAKLDE